MKIPLAVLALLLSLAAVPGRCGQAQDAPDVAEIVARANHAALYQGRDCSGAVSMTIADRQGRERIRAFNTLRLNADAGDREQKYFVYFHEPADVRKMAFMVHKHVGAGRDDDRWLYLPSLDLVKRIAASDKRTSFAGSHFLYEDISGRSPQDDTHELLASTAGRYVVKNAPRDPGAVEFAYYVAEIDARTFIPMKLTYYRKDNQPYRVIEVLEVQEVAAEEDGRPVAYPTVTRSLARDLDSEGRTEMVFSSVRYNLGLEHGLFTERYLRRAPREVLR